MSLVPQLEIQILDCNASALCCGCPCCSSGPLAHFPTPALVCTLIVYQAGNKAHTLALSRRRGPEGPHVVEVVKEGTLGLMAPNRSGMQSSWRSRQFTWQEDICTEEVSKGYSWQHGNGDSRQPLWPSSPPHANALAALVGPGQRSFSKGLLYSEATECGNGWAVTTWSPPWWVNSMAQICLCFGMTEFDLLREGKEPFMPSRFSEAQPTWKTREWMR